MTVIEELRARRYLLAQPGVWVQGPPSWDQAGCACLVSYRPLHGKYTSLSTQAWQALNTVLEDMGVLREIGIGPGMWNDAPGRTLDEVLDLLDRTIARLEATA